MNRVHVGETAKSKPHLLVLSLFRKDNHWRSRNDILREIMELGEMICSIVPISEMEDPKNGFEFKRKRVGRHFMYRLTPASLTKALRKKYDLREVGKDS